MVGILPYTQNVKNVKILNTMRLRQRIHLIQNRECSHERENVLNKRENL